MNERASGLGRAELGSEHRPWDGPRSVSISGRIGKARVLSDVSCECGETRQHVLARVQRTGRSLRTGVVREALTEVTASSVLLKSWLAEGTWGT